MASNFIKSIEIQSIDVSTILAETWSEIGNPLEGALSYIKITNDSNTDIIISFDNSAAKEDNLYILADTSREIYFQSNSVPTNYTSKLRKHSVAYIRGTAGVGNVYLEGFYNE